MKITDEMVEAAKEAYRKPQYMIPNTSEGSLTTRIYSALESALAVAPEPEWEVQYGRRNRETGALHWLTGSPRDDWWHENQDRYEHVKRYMSPPLPVEGEGE
jgi:hypothetical protein